MYVINWIQPSWCASNMEFRYQWRPRRNVQRFNGWRLLRPLIRSILICVSRQLSRPLEKETKTTVDISLYFSFPVPSYPCPFYLPLPGHTWCQVYIGLQHYIPPSSNCKWLASPWFVPCAAIRWKCFVQISPKGANSKLSLCFSQWVCRMLLFPLFLFQGRHWMCK